jgi:hypothetical protein
LFILLSFAGSRDRDKLSEVAVDSGGARTSTA